MGTRADKSAVSVHRPNVSIADIHKRALSFLNKTRYSMEELGQCTVPTSSGVTMSDIRNFFGGKRGNGLSSSQEKPAAKSSVSE